MTIRHGVLVKMGILTMARQLAVPVQETHVMSVKIMM